jgi:hypothetical protein
MLGLREGTPVSAAVIDAHAGVPGAGVASPSTMVLVMGTSSCHMMNSRVEKLVPGIAGVVEDGILPGYIGYETGQASAHLPASDSTAHVRPPLTLTRGARHIAFLPGGRALVLLRGEIQHKNLWLINLETGAERQLTNLTQDFDVRNFDISPDGREVILERVQDLSDIALLDLPKP